MVSPARPRRRPPRAERYARPGSRRGPARPGRGEPGWPETYQPGESARPSRDENRRGRSRTGTRILVALVCLLVGAALAGATYTVGSSRPAQWTSEPQLLISPDSDLDPAATTSFYEALSRGQITATAAAITGQRAVLDQALDRADLTSSGVTVNVSVVPETTVLKVSVSAPRAEDAQRVASEVVAESVDRLEALIPSYDVTPLTSQVPAATSTGATEIEVYAATAAVGVGAAVALYVALISLSRGRRRRLDR